MENNEQRPVGEVTHYYTKLGVAIVKFSKEVPAGMELHYKGATTDFQVPASSMQYDHKPVEKAKKGQEIGIKVPEHVREGDKVFLVE